MKPKALIYDHTIPLVESQADSEKRVDILRQLAEQRGYQRIDVIQDYNATRPGSDIG